MKSVLSTFFGVAAHSFDGGGKEVLDGDVEALMFCIPVIFLVSVKATCN